MALGEYARSKDSARGHCGVKLRIETHVAVPFLAPVAGRLYLCTYASHLQLATLSEDAA